MKKEKATKREPKVQVTVRMNEMTDSRLKNISEQMGSSYNSLLNIAVNLGLKLLESDLTFQDSQR